MLEFKRVFLSKPLIGALIVLIIANVFYFFKYEKNDDDYVATYTQLIDDCDGLSIDEATQKILKIQNDNTYIRIAYRWQDCDEETKEFYRSTYGADFAALIDKVETGEYSVSDEEFKRAWEIYPVTFQINEQLTHLNEFSDYYEQIKKNAQSMSMFSIFSNPDSFANKNIQKTVEDFACIENVEGSLDNELAINSFFSGKIADYSVLAFMAVAALMLVTERKNGLWELVHSSKNGRGTLILKRTLTLLVCSFAGVTILIVGRFALACAINGGAGDLSRAVQSNSLFGGIAQNISMGGFLLEYYVFKVIGMWLAGMAVWLILLLFSNTNAAIAVSSVFIVLEYVLFTTIPDSYSLVVFRFINIFAFVDFERIFGAYLNIELFDKAVTGSALTIALIPVAAILLTVICLLCGCLKKPVKSPSIFARLWDKIQKFYDKLVSKLGTFGNEMNKLLIHQKGIALVIFLVIWAIFIAQVPTPDDGYDAITAYNKTLYQGVVTEETLDSIKTEIDSLMAIEAKSQFESSKLSALSEIYNEGQELLEMGKLDGVKYCLVDSSCYEALISENANNVSLIALLFVVLLCAGVFVYENKNSTKPILRSCANGMNMVWRTKVRAVLLLTTAVWAVIYGTHIILCIGMYGGFPMLGAPIGSFLTSTALPKSMPVYAWLILIYLLRLLAMYAIAGAVSFVSVLMKNANLSVIVCCAVFVLPALLFAVIGGGTIKITFADALVYGDDYMSMSNIVLIASSLVIGILSYMFCYLLWKKREA